MDLMLSLDGRNDTSAARANQYFARKTPLPSRTTSPALQIAAMAEEGPHAGKEQVSAHKWAASRRIRSFLSHRCTPEPSFHWP
mmetsp:Transcript_22504/g.46683  ORF Transcript_22504/g.46683 Transcript_22504/m.46683 type:complete len:83 (-) Transcript_22504:354-602(-)